MKCFKHNADEAVAVCSYCGRGVCPNCVPPPTTGRVICSKACENALVREGKVLQMLLDKSAQGSKANAVYCYLTGGLSGVAAIAAWFILPSPFLIYFTGGCAVALVAAGIWFGRMARQPGLDS